jgi:hypothetical protein
MVHDLYWIHDGFVGEYLDIALGVKPPESLEGCCDNKLKLLQYEVLPFFLEHPLYAIAAPLLSEIIKNFEQNSYLTTNILMPVVIESLTRELAAWVYNQQNPIIDAEAAAKYVAGFLSLESLILKADFPVNFYNAALEIKFINDPKLSWAAKTLTDWDIAKETLTTLVNIIIKVLNNQSITDNEKQEISLALSNEAHDLMVPFNGIDQKPVFVTLKVKLQFLVRRFKEDRNAIIHGHFLNWIRCGNLT